MHKLCCFFFGREGRWENKLTKLLSILSSLIHRQMYSFEAKAVYNVGFNSTNSIIRSFIVFIRNAEKFSLKTVLKKITTTNKMKRKQITESRKYSV